MDNQTNISPQEKVLSLGAGSTLAAAGAGLLLRGRILPALGALAAGGALLYRGKTCHCPAYEALGIDTSDNAEKSTEVTPLVTSAATAANSVAAKLPLGPVNLNHAVTVNKSAGEIYDFWQDATNFSKFMPQITSVEKQGDAGLKWTAQAPTGQTLHWESEIVEEKPGELLRWETKSADAVAGAAVPHSGQLSLKELAHDRGTEVKLEMSYDPSAGALGAALATVFKAVPSQYALESLRRFKQLMEAGELAQAQNQPA